MPKKKNFEMNIVDSGCEDDLQKRLEIAKQKLKQKENETNFPILSTKNIIILFIWGVLYKLFINWGFGVV
jgi:hypothetical protein